MKETGKEGNSLQGASSLCVSVSVCVSAYILQREVCVWSGWVHHSLGLSFSVAHSATVLSSSEWKHHVSVGRPEEQPRFSTLRPDQVGGFRMNLTKSSEQTLLKSGRRGAIEDSSQPLGLGYAMLTQSNGVPPGCKSVSLKDRPDLQDVDVNTVGCCSLSSSSPSSGCPWARLAGVDGCLSEPYCLWFQLLAKAYWGEVELGLTTSNRSVSWARLREASKKNCIRSRVRMDR